MEEAALITLIIAIWAFLFDRPEPIFPRPRLAFGKPLILVKKQTANAGTRQTGSAALPKAQSWEVVTLASSRREEQLNGLEFFDVPPRFFSRN